MTREGWHGDPPRELEAWISARGYARDTMRHKPSAGMAVVTEVRCDGRLIARAVREMATRRVLLEPVLIVRETDGLWRSRHIDDVGAVEYHALVPCSVHRAGHVIDLVRLNDVEGYAGHPRRIGVSDIAVDDDE